MQKHLNFSRWGQFKARCLCRFGFAIAVLFVPYFVYSSGTITNLSFTALKNAISPNGGTVTIACDGTFNFSGTILIQSNTVIDATGHNVIFDGIGQFKLLSIQSPSSPYSSSFPIVTISNVTFVNGGSFYYNPNSGYFELRNGGGVEMCGGDVSFYNCVFTNNHTTSYNGYNGTAGAPNGNGNGGNGGGGGRSSGPLDPTVAGVFGGAIANADGILRVIGSTFISNSVVGGSGGRGGNGGQGTGIGGNGGNGGQGCMAEGGAIG